ncbi:protein dispatched homolog 1-like [Mytilus galloprovincialis]|uniref:protein dispatched homolog 1-like n=1 Tax=Mytilus galloprovincialis TaxID=29158 RepID=UPI003F7BA23E
MASDETSKPAWSNSDEALTHDAEKLQQERRNRKPFFYCRWVATRPYLMFFVTLILQLFPVVITGILFGVNYDLFPTNFEVLPMELYDIPYRVRDYAYRDKHKFDNSITRSLTDTGYPTYERGLSYSFSNIELFFDADGGNILTKANLQTIKYIEEHLIASDGYSTSFCHTKNSSLICKDPTSLIRYFDGTFSSVSPTFNDPTFSNIAGVIYEAYTNNLTKADFEYFLPKSYSITPTTASFSVTRTQIAIGCSLSGSTKCLLMRDTAREWLGKTMKPRLETLLDDISQFDFYYISSNLLFYDVIQQAMKDMMFAIGSMFFIFCFMTFHTRSLFVSGLAVMSILTSFAGTNLIYRCIIGFEYLGFFHVLAIFIILGIGADDLFVFYDSWRLTAFSSYPSLAHRLTEAYSKSCKSMLITSITTAVAFTASALSPLLATKSFGVFAAILVIYNYLSVIIFFPTVVMVYHIKYEDWTWPCCRCRKKGDNCKIENDQRTNSMSKVVPENVYTVQSNDTKDPSSPIKGDFVRPSVRLSPIKAKELSDKSKIENGYTTRSVSEYDNDINKPMTTKQKLNSPCIPKAKQKEKKLVVFFRDHYWRFITSKWTRFALLPVFIATVCVFGYYASTLEPDNENLQLFQDDHHYSKAVYAQEYTMLVSTADSLVQIHVVWGLKNKDRSHCHFSSIQCRGNNVYDDDFDPNTVANQQALMTFCNRLYNMTAAEIQEYKIRTDSSTGQLEVACFTKDLDTFLQSKSADIGIGDLSLPWDYTKTMNFMNALPSHYDTSSFTTAFQDYLAIPVGYWLYNEFQKNYTSDFGHHDALIGEYKNTSGFTQQLLSDSSIYYGTQFKYIAVEINTTINRKTTGYATGIPLVELWETFINDQVSTMPTGLKGGFQLTFQTWHWFYVQKSLADNAVQGIIIGVTLAFPILTLTTMNVIIGFFATMSICCTTICVIGVIPLAGWKLGLLVSLNMCIVVGLAVDYVVHLAEGYHLSLHKDRLNRTRDMLEEMATSVFSGACTTLGASCFMFFAMVQFFLQFGIFLFCTIGFSLFFSLGLFTLLMGMLGPENNTGCLKTLFAKCRNKLKKTEKTEKTETDSEITLNQSMSASTISAAGSQNKLIQSQVPPHVSRINVNGFDNKNV